MATSKATDWGWFFLRAGAGLVIFSMGLKAWQAGGADLRAVAQIAAGGAAVLGLFVRPCALFVLLAMAWLTVSSRGIGLRLFYEAVAPLLFAVGLLIGGGGSVLALGSMIAGFRGRWWQ